VTYIVIPAKLVLDIDRGAGIQVPCKNGASYRYITSNLFFEFYDLYGLISIGGIQEQYVKGKKT